ncbi:MAG: YIP1 family protein [Euryarchaeota archaeon]|nr:YIP1 family protein [Euryarchaeota archaeon]
MSEFIDEFIGTWKKVITTPGDFFKEMPTSGGYEEPLKFAVINYLISGIGIALITFGSMFAAVIAAPIFGIIVLFIFGLMFHVCFKIVGGSGNYEGTVRIMAYASAVEAVSWIPIIGWIIALYAIYLAIVGGTFVHNITTLRSAMAIFIPIAVLTIIAVLLIVMLGMALFTTFEMNEYCGY